MDIYEKFLNSLGFNVSWANIDSIVMSDANILRPVKGAAFEILFDEIVINHLGGQISPGPGGDTDIDRILKNKNDTINLQLKTCATGSTKQNVRVGVNLHKTHGIEKRPNNLYPFQWPCPHCNHEGEEFPPYLVVLHPQKGILIIPKEHIPESSKHKGHFADPAYFNWNSKWLNRWDLLGYPQFKGQSLERRSIPRQQKFPNICEVIKLTDEELVRLWLSPENFRTLEMNLKGNIREHLLKNWLESQGLPTEYPVGIAYPKYDLITPNGIKIQSKGPSKAMCNINATQVGTEVMGTHGRGSVRMYSSDVFDYLGFVIDPIYIPQNIGLDHSICHFCLIPITALPLHHNNSEWKTANKLYPNCKFIIDSDNNGVFLKPSTNYRVNISFREQGPWYIDTIPQGLT